MGRPNQRNARLLQDRYSHTMTRTTQHTGFTLIELLLYISIVGSLLIAVSLFFATTADARIKSQSIAEVNQQGTLAMDYILQTIRNADAINTPATGASASSLSLAVPTASLSPTIFDASASSTMGYNQDGGSTDSNNSDSINATKFTAGSSGTVTTLYAFVGPTISASPNNLAQMAIYSGTSSPTTLLASSASIALTGNSWNAFPISSVNITSGQTYWLAYNTNGSTSGANNLRYHSGTAGQSMFTDQTFGTWPNSWSGTGQAVEFSMYAPIQSGAASALQVKEGTGAIVPLTNNKVQISGLTFKNLTRSGTPGIVQVSFTLSRASSSGRSEYTYQKTFTSSAALRQP